MHKEKQDKNGVQVSYRDTVYGKEHKYWVSTRKEHYKLENVTYILEGGRVIQDYGMASEKEIFDYYNDKKNEYCFIMAPDNGRLHVGMGSGALFGGLDKELIFFTGGPELKSLGI